MAAVIMTGCKLKKNGTGTADKDHAYLLYTIEGSEDPDRFIAGCNIFLLAKMEDPCKSLYQEGLRSMIL